MNKKQYSSAIKKTPFKYPIAKKIAKLMLDGLDYDEVYNHCYNDNYIEIDSLERRREITNVVYKRLCSLDDYLLKELHDADITTSKFILVYAIAKTDALFFDFLYERYREALLSTERRYLSMDDFDGFFEEKKEIDINVAKWGSFTLQCLTKGYRNILVESGLGKREKKTIAVDRVLIHPAVESHIREIGDTDYLKAMLGSE